MTSAKGLGRRRVADADVVDDLGRAQALLVCDTSSLLDILRSPTEGPKAVSERDNARRLLARIDGGELVALAPERVFVELDRHRDRLVRRARDDLAAYQKTVRATYALTGKEGFGSAPGDLKPDDYAEVLHAQLRPWARHLVELPQSPDAVSRALSRVDRHAAPSSNAKQELWDCLIVETVFEGMDALRAQGMEQRCLFVSSNTSDYKDPDTRRARSPLREEFGARGIEYVPSFAEAMRSLLSM